MCDGKGEAYKVARPRGNASFCAMIAPLF